MTESAARRGLVERVLGAYWDFSGSMRAVLADRPSEATLLSFLLIASLIRYFGQIVEIYTGATAGGEASVELFQTRVAETFVGALILAPLAVYLIASLAKPIAGWFGGTGDWFDTRAAFAWAYLVTAPVFLLRAVIEAVLSASGLDPAVLAPVEVSLSLAFGAFGLYVLGACLAAAHGFPSATRTALALGAMLIAIAGGVVVLTGGAAGS